jgi:hypothetical protein
MLTNKAQQSALPQGTPDALRNWLMVVLTPIFVALYGAALIGWLKPLAAEKMVLGLEPIIFVIIGYYFGRLPAQQNEKTLKDEIVRTQKAGAAQLIKKQAMQIRGLQNTGGPINEKGLRYSVGAALRVLNSWMSRLFRECEID